MFQISNLKKKIMNEFFILTLLQNELKKKALIGYFTAMYCSEKKLRSS